MVHKYILQQMENGLLQIFLLEDIQGQMVVRLLVAEIMKTKSIMEVVFLPKKCKNILIVMIILLTAILGVRSVNKF